MSWPSLQISADGTHHIHEDGHPAYDERFHQVLEFHAPGLAAVRRDGSAWHIRPDGSPAYDPRFIRTFGFYEGWPLSSQTMAGITPRSTEGRVSCSVRLVRQFPAGPMPRS
ncbi:MAG: hypothetical protein R3B13_38035 [Polyangiaceae bacterium]